MSPCSPCTILRLTSSPRPPRCRTCQRSSRTTACPARRRSSRTTVHPARQPRPISTSARGPLRTTRMCWAARRAWIPAVILASWLTIYLTLRWRNYWLTDNILNLFLFVLLSSYLYAVILILVHKSDFRTGDKRDCM
ncbi:hypothetical protein B0H17DRAFT_712241 [Mycena rosella]|uniref:Uncharacterized protein n=1 Tax=Mycena rosella TaxID=1033263 RepID=A0AAD7DA90_MYCRO|nr:hypothetical protein B0H17DRAFT_712241 [Mycena rosella]